ncbi:MAG: DUF2764 domain-containing protein [Bacteroidales bacterium]|nr:DUF2764 domain-containing protein [Bacteroidales bacterium]
MFKTNYFCLVAGLPDIIINETKSVVSSREFKNELSEQLEPADYKLAELLYLNYDNQNLLNLILEKNKPFNNIGKYTQEELEEQIKEPTYIIDYMKQFILDFKAEETKLSDLSWENKLQTLFFDFVLITKNDFLKKWFRFDMDIKNILTAINCQQFDYEKEEHLISVKHKNEVYKNLIKDTLKSESLSDEVLYAEKILQIVESDDNSSGKEKATDMIKWTFLDEFTFFKYFNIEKILAFIIKLNIVERWIKLDNETGEELFKKLINDLGVENITVS